MIEEFIRFGSGDALVGTLSTAAPGTPSPAAPCAVLFINAGVIHRVGPHRVTVRWARRLAREGIPSLRFDLAGLGDSAGIPGRVDGPERGVPDIAAAMDLLRARLGIERVVLVGICAGAIQSFKSAVRDERVIGAMLIDIWVYRTLRSRLLRLIGRFKKPRRMQRVAKAFRRGVLAIAGSVSASAAAGPVDWLSVANPPVAEFSAGVRRILERGSRLYFVYTGTLGENYNYDRQLADTVGSLSRHPGFRCERWQAATHTFIDTSSQSMAADRMTAWIESLE